jgi:hypothetical protein
MQKLTCLCGLQAGCQACIAKVKLSLWFAGGLPGDPRTWCREDVCLFLQYCEREFDLEKIDMDKFVMNGKFSLSVR